MAALASLNPIPTPGQRRVCNTSLVIFCPLQAFPSPQSPVTNIKPSSPVATEHSLGRRTDVWTVPYLTSTRLASPDRHHTLLPTRDISPYGSWTRAWSCVPTASQEKEASGITTLNTITPPLDSGAFELRSIPPGPRSLRLGRICPQSTNGFTIPRPLLQNHNLGTNQRPASHPKRFLRPQRP